MSCPQCFTGHVNPGTPQGSWETIHGLKTYVAAPEDGKQPLGIIVIIPDAFGVGFINNQILADHYSSAAQYLVYMPDFMAGRLSVTLSCFDLDHHDVKSFEKKTLIHILGKEAPVRTMLNMAHMFDEKESWLWKPYYAIATMVDFIPFLIRNRAGVCWPRVTKFLRDLREDKGATLPVGIAGFCWGGLHAIKLSHDNEETRTADGRPLIDAVFAAHPSNAAVPADFEAIKHSMSIAIGDDDAVMGIAQVREAEKILARKEDVVSEVIVYPGAKHGFAVRASRSKPDSQETKQAEEAEKQAIAWFQRRFEATKGK